MIRDGIICLKVRTITLIPILELDSNHRAFHQPVQHHMAVSSKACETVTMGSGSYSSERSLSVEQTERIW